MTYRYTACLVHHMPFFFAATSYFISGEGQDIYQTLQITNGSLSAAEELQERKTEFA